MNIEVISFSFYPYDFFVPLTKYLDHFKRLPYERKQKRLQKLLKNKV